MLMYATRNQWHNVPNVFRCAGSADEIAQNLSGAHVWKNARFYIDRERMQYFNKSAHSG